MIMTNNFDHQTYLLLDYSSIIGISFYFAILIKTYAMCSIFTNKANFLFQKMYVHSKAMFLLSILYIHIIDFAQRFVPISLF